MIINLSCYECGNTFLIYETHFESMIKDSVETTGSPFEYESTFPSTENRATEKKKRNETRKQIFTQRS
jgi:hypothetical protein